jgi:hypothetical protein
MKGRSLLRVFIYYYRDVDVSGPWLRRSCPSEGKGILVLVQYQVNPTRAPLWPLHERAWLEPFKGPFYLWKEILGGLWLEESLTESGKSWNGGRDVAVHVWRHLCQG